MGQYAANNIHQRIIAQQDGGKPTYQELKPFPAVMGLALGHKAVTYSPAEGTKDGEELMAQMFGEDMGNSSMCTQDQSGWKNANIWSSMPQLHASEPTLSGIMRTINLSEQDLPFPHLHPNLSALARDTGAFRTVATS